mmetsp:Transcript_5891/g.14949  ORF Transcript_5891/g.14949 Transcript_5891/m.14949 type:complete len:247 (+) Transcript_5891:164-904(+)
MRHDAAAPCGDRLAVHSCSSSSAKAGCWRKSLSEILVVVLPPSLSFGPSPRSLSMNSNSASVSPVEPAPRLSWKTRRSSSSPSRSSASTSNRSKATSISVGPDMALSRAACSYRSCKKMQNSQQSIRLSSSMSSCASMAEAPAFEGVGSSINKTLVTADVSIVPSPVKSNCAKVAIVFGCFISLVTRRKKAAFSCDDRPASSESIAALCTPRRCGVLARACRRLAAAAASAAPAAWTLEERLLTHA